MSVIPAIQGYIVYLVATDFEKKLERETSWLFEQELTADSTPELSAIMQRFFRQKTVEIDCEREHKHKRLVNLDSQIINFYPEFIWFMSGGSDGCCWDVNERLDSIIGRKINDYLIDC